MKDPVVHSACMSSFLVLKALVVVVVLPSGVAEELEKASRRPWW